MKTLELASSLRSVVSALHKGLQKQMHLVNAYSMTEVETIASLVKHPDLLPTELAVLTRVKTLSMSQT